MKRYIVTLTLEEQEKLREIIAKRNSKAEIVKRAFVLLSLDENRTGGRLSDEEIRAQRVGSREELEKQVEAYQTARNAKEVKIEWHFTTADARVKLKRLYPSIQS